MPHIEGTIVYGPHSENDRSGIKSLEKTFETAFRRYPGRNVLAFSEEAYLTTIQSDAIFSMVQNGTSPYEAYFWVSRLQRTDPIPSHVHLNRAVMDNEMRTRQDLSLQEMQLYDKLKKKYPKNLQISFEGADPDLIEKRHNEEERRPIGIARMNSFRLMHEGNFMEALGEYKYAVLSNADLARQREKDVIAGILRHADKCNPAVIAGYFGLGHRRISSLLNEKGIIVSEIISKTEALSTYDEAVMNHRDLKKNYSPLEWQRSMIGYSLYETLRMIYDGDPKKPSNEVITDIIQGILEGFNTMDDVNRFYRKVREKGYTEALSQLD